MELNRIYNMDALEGLKTLPAQSVNCCVTSPPYYGLRDYGVAGQMGLEDTPEKYVSKMVEVFEEVRRVLKDDGRLWVNIGDSYAANRGSGASGIGDKQKTNAGANLGKLICPQGYKPKDLFGVPWMLAFALRSRGWYLRSDIIWAKPNCMPESVTDRPTRSHEYIFLLSKSSKYYYDHEAIKEPALYDVDGTGTASRKARQKENNKSVPDGIRAAGFKNAGLMNGKHSEKQIGHSRRHDGFNDWCKNQDEPPGMRNKRDVWTVSPAQFPEAHFATFPEDLIVPCIKAGCPEGGVVLDPFMGAATTALVARKLNRNYRGFELNPDYITIAENRLKKELGMFL